MPLCWASATAFSTLSSSSVTAWGLSPKTAILGALMPKSVFNATESVVILATRKRMSIWASASSKGMSSVAMAMRMMSFTIKRNASAFLKLENRKSWLICATLLLSGAITKASVCPLRISSKAFFIEITDISAESSVAAPGSIFNSFSTILMMLNLPGLA